jgi:hypothetical protein
MEPMGKSDDITDDVIDEAAKSVNSIALAMDVGPGSIEMALYRAEIAYLCDPHLRGVNYFWQMMDGQVDLATFQVHARERKWEVQRLKVRQKAQADLVRRLSNQIVSDQLAEAADLSKLRGWFFQLLTPEEVEYYEDGRVKARLHFQVEPNSLEGCVKALRDITVLLQAYRGEVLSTLEPMVPDMHAGVSSDDVGPFSQHEAGEMARSILDRRRRDRQRVLPAHATKADNKD